MNFTHELKILIIKTILKSWLQHTICHTGMSGSIWRCTVCTLLYHDAKELLSMQGLLWMLVGSRLHNGTAGRMSKGTWESLTTPTSKVHKPGSVAVVTAHPGAYLDFLWKPDHIMNFVSLVGGKMPAQAKLIELSESCMTATHLWFTKNFRTSVETLCLIKYCMHPRNTVWIIWISMAWRCLVNLLLSSSN